MICEVPTSNLKDLMKSCMGIKWAKHLMKPILEAEKFFLCQGLVGKLFSVAQISMSKAQKDFGSAHTQLTELAEDLGGHKMVKSA